MLLLSVLLIAASSYCSHRIIPRDGQALDGQRVLVDNIVDGNTLLVRDPNNRLDRLRLRGVIAPQPARDGRPAEHFAIESKRYLKDRIDGRKVIVQFDGTVTRDADGYLLAFVYVTESDCINLATIRDGYAYVDRQATTFMQSQLNQAEGDARKKERGLWKGLAFDQMPIWRQDWLRSRKASE